MSVQVAAPRDLVPDGPYAHRRVRGELVSGPEAPLGPSLNDPHVALDHRDPRALEATVDREDRAGDVDGAVARGHHQVADPALGRLDDDAAPLEVDLCVLAAGGDAELRSLAQLHDRPVAQPQHRLRASRGADRLAVADLLTRPEGAGGAPAHPLQRAAQRLHAGAPARGSGDEGLPRRERREAERQQDRGGLGPAPAVSPLRRGLVRRRTPRQYRETGSARLAIGRPTGRALTQVVLHEGGPRRLKRASPIRGQERLDVGAAPDAGRWLGAKLGRPGERLQDPCGRCRRRGRGHVLVADGRDRLVQRDLLSCGWLAHRLPLVRSFSSRRSRKRARCRVTATVRRDVPSIRAISRLS